MSTELVVKEKRADALDALRGIAILTMILSGSIPFSEPHLPAWMYHAQVPPPLHKFISTLPGITWVDLVFPFFLFAMGTAFPFALSKKIDAGVAKWKISLQALQRGLLLAAFAIYIQHIKPYAINGDPDTNVWLLSLFGYALLFPMLMRLPKSVNKYIQWGVKSAGYIAAIILVASMSYNGKTFSFSRSDIIILVLANVAVFGSVIWIFTHDNLTLRLGVLGFLIAIRLTQSSPDSWNHWLWDLTPAAWLYKLYYLQYLFIVIPGTIAGDLILRWMKSGKEELMQTEKKYNDKRLFLASILLFLFIPLNLIGLFVRDLNSTILANIAFCGVGLFLFSKIYTSLDVLYKSLFQWGTYWLILGLFFEAYEGGIKKDHPTVSYYFVTTGLAIFTYMFFSIVIDYFKYNRVFKLLIENGQNPMIAYISGSNLILPVLALTSLNVYFNKLLINPWLGFLKGVIFTLLVALVTSFATKKKIFWRT